MGPQASLRLHQLLLSESDATGERAPDEYPAILHASLSVPDFITNKEAERIAIDVINDACASLPLTTATSIGMACNTAHLLLNQLNIPRGNFVSMIDAVVRQAETLQLKNVGLLASPNTISSGLYKNAFERVGIVVVEPLPNEIETLNRLIHQVIAYHNPQTLQPELTSIAENLINQGADSILLGCTELPLIGVDVNTPVIDSLSALAKAMLERR